jgi:hypothetical protein
MTLFAGAVDVIATGLQLIGATTVVVGPVLWLAQPTLTPRGRSRKGIDLAVRGYRRAIPRSHPADGYPSAKAPATEGE